MRARATCIALALAATALVGCSDAPTGSPDTGTTTSDTGARCRTDADCSDGVFCNGAERCIGDASGGDARSCAPATTASPCTGGDTCDETMDRCVSACSDADGDGHVGVACGGDDCDDLDPHRFPGNTEVCTYSPTTMVRVDPSHDEDCNAMTYANGSVGDGDQDGDGYVDAQCLNTDAMGHVFRGPDCADLGDVTPTAPFTVAAPAANVHPTQSESCNGIDDDCNGMIDDGLATGTYYPDCDGDNFGDMHATGVALCRRDAQLCNGHAYVADHTDCDDTANTAHAGQAEVCDNIDNDCNGTVDDSAPANASCTTMFPTTAHATVACDPTAHACVLTCAANFGDCDGMVDTGCEADLRVDAQHCGSCTNACPVAATCSARACEHLRTIDAGATHTCGIYAVSGHAVCWGGNADGQLGDGTRINQAHAVAVAPPTGGTPISFAYLDAGGERRETDLGGRDSGHTCGGTSSTMYCWGAGMVGQLGNTISGTMSAPAVVARIPEASGSATGLPTLIGAAAGGRHTLALQREPRGANVAFQIWAWGQNESSQFLATTPASSPTPVPTVLTVTTPAALTSISATLATSCYVASPSGALYCAGNVVFSTTPTLMTLPAGWTGVAEVATGGLGGFGPNTGSFYGGESICARRAGASGPVFCWGTVSGLVPGLTDAISVTVGGRHACAVRATGSVVCWGSNLHGVLGGETPPPPLMGDLPNSTPYPVHVVTNAVRVSAGAEHTCALTSDGSVWCWGNDDVGQLGDGGLGTSTDPTRVLGI